MPLPLYKDSEEEKIGNLQGKNIPTYFPLALRKVVFSQTPLKTACYNLGDLFQALSNLTIFKP